MLSLAILASIGASACGQAESSEFTASTGPGGGADTRFHPAPNMVHVSEDEACSKLHDAVVNRQFELKCIGTVQQCPSMIRSLYSPHCMKYDEGTVNACVEYLGKIMDCQAVGPNQCVLIGYPETAPTGCS
jgi:hypothetical protein